MAASSACPCCGLVVAIDKMNVHLDGCLIDRGEQPSSSAVVAAAGSVQRRQSARHAARQQQHRASTSRKAEKPAKSGRAARGQVQPRQQTQVAATPTRQQQQQQQQRKRHHSSTSIYRGVSWNKHTSKWMAYITCAGQRQHIGYFTDDAAAARAYDVRARQLHGVAARPNFPRAGERQSVAQHRKASAGAAEVVAMRKKRRQSTSNYRGVHWAAGLYGGGAWVAKSQQNGRYKLLGRFADEAEAASAYDDHVRELQGAAAMVNFPCAGERQACGELVDPGQKPAS